MTVTVQAFLSFPNYSVLSAVWLIHHNSVCSSSKVFVWNGLLSPWRYPYVGCSLFVSVSVSCAYVYAFYAFYAWWSYFPQSGALAEGTSRPMFHKHVFRFEASPLQTRFMLTFQPSKPQLELSLCKHVLCSSSHSLSLQVHSLVSVSLSLSVCLSLSLHLLCVSLSHRAARLVLLFYRKMNNQSQHMIPWCRIVFYWLLANTYIHAHMHMCINVHITYTYLTYMSTSTYNTRHLPSYRRGNQHTYMYAYMHTYIQKIHINIQCRLHRR